MLLKGKGKSIEHLVSTTHILSVTLSLLASVNFASSISEK